MKKHTKNSPMLAAPLQCLVSWISKAMCNVTFFVCVFPFFIIGLVAHRIAYFLVTGFLIGWEYSKSLEDSDNA